MPSPPRTPAEQTLAQMYLPEGFQAEVVVEEPEVQQPVAFTFDEHGRIWVAEAYSYPQKRPPGQGLDKIVIFEDRDGDGKFETRKVFAEGLNLVSGLEVGYGGVWIGAAPELLFVPDRNHDDVPDSPPEVMLDGFGFQDTHECLNSFLWGPDGWLYGNQGVFNTAHIGKPGAPDAERVELRAGVWRYHPVRRQFEVFAHGGSNQWGLDYDERGQIFMTHCRSYWGRGCTTHVIQGGHYWNQANANHAPFIIANPPRDFPDFRNYLLASARYDHGAGGAGKPGSDAIYGGHAHVGTMIYLGDNWPDEFRGHLFTHNLGGHQINHQVNRRLGSGFNTVHAGRDQSFCSDPKYVAIDLQYGPDGAVYVIDWYDQQHCHNPNTERWDRSNGRIYRIEYAATYKPRHVDLGGLDDARLAELHRNKNEWFVRTARRLLHERAQARAVEPNAKLALLEICRQNPDPLRRLAGLWTLHAIGAFSDDVARHALADSDEYVRGWTVQLLSDDRNVSPALLGEVVGLAKQDPSPVVRLYLASAIQRVPQETAWELIDALAAHGEDCDDRNLPFLLWDGLAQRMTASRHPAAGHQSSAEDASPSPGRSPRPSDGRGVRGEGGPTPKTRSLGAGNGRESKLQNAAAERKRGLDKGLSALDRAFAVAERAQIPQLADWVYWYAATLDGAALNRAVAALEKVQGETQRRRLAGLWLAMEARANVAMPAGWKQSAPRLYASQDARVRRLAERLAAVFGDDSIFARLREELSNASAEVESRKHAFAVLSRGPDRSSLPVFLKLLDDPAFRTSTISLLARLEGPEVTEALLSRFGDYSAADRSAALNALIGRASSALALLDAVAAGRLPRQDLTSFHIRQLWALKDPEVNKRVSATWGRISETAAEQQARINRLETVFNEAPLWAYDTDAGREHFQKLCAQCHRLGNDGVRLGPELTGAGKNGVRYFLENITDPNAVVGTDFRMTNLDMKNGGVISGLVVNETTSALTIRTAVEQVVVPKADIAGRTLSENSLMPEGLLESLGEREQIELLKFLTSN